MVGIAGRLQTGLNWRWLQFLGLISYSLYLIHNLVTGAAFRIGFILTGRSVFTEVLWWVGSLAACTLFATAMWWTIERPSTVWARKVRLSVNGPNALALPSSPAS